MEALDLSNVGIPLFEMRCPLCQRTQYVKVRNTEPHITRCLHCKGLLAYSVITKEKPNHVLLKLVITGLPDFDKES